MFVLALTDRDHEQKRPFATLEFVEPKHVTDVRFSVFSPSEDLVRATLHKYPRRTEPAVALLARCLNLIDNELPFLPASQTYHLQILEGETVKAAELVETLDVELREHTVHVTWEDTAQKRRIESPTLENYMDAGEFIAHGARLAAWCTDDVPLLPFPLVDCVKVRDRGGIRCVNEDEVPGFARMALNRRLKGEPRPRFGAFYAHDWFDFLTS